MKTVKGEVLSTTPISVSKAASILSKFVSADTGASQAVCAYLRRASASFNELNQLHKEIKTLRKHKTPKSETVIEDGEPSRSSKWNQHDGEESEGKKHKKKKKKEERGCFGNDVKIEGEFFGDKVRIEIVDGDLGVEDEKKKHKKKRAAVGHLEEGKATGEVKIQEDGNVAIEDNNRKKHKKNKGENEDKIGNLEEDKDRIKIEEDANMGIDKGRKKHKKKRETREYQVGDLKENGGRIVVEEEEEEKKKKKRKSEDIEEGRETNSEEYPSRKKKKIKSEVS